MEPKSWSVKGLLKVSADYLTRKQIESPRLTAEVLLTHQLHTNRVNLYLNLDQPLNETEVSGYRELIRRRVQREPLQYIIGVQEFWSMDFLVDPRVLIPRPETELLVEQAIQRFQTNTAAPLHSPIKILDLGTGSGILATTLAKEIQPARIWASDISKEAIDLARMNAEKHEVSDRIEFIIGDLWQACNDHLVFDLIVSNPPYVSDQEFPNLPPEVRDFEPRIALDGKEDGFHYIEKIINGCANFLVPAGWLLLETAPEQTEKAIRLIKTIGAFGETGRIKDYSHQFRVVYAQKKTGDSNEPTEI